MASEARVPFLAMAGSDFVEMLGGWLGLRRLCLVRLLTQCVLVKRDTYVQTRVMQDSVLPGCVTYSAKLVS